MSKKYSAQCVENKTKSRKNLDKVRRQLLSECGAMCCAPECEKRFYEETTFLAECAHIISHAEGGPRGDGETSAEERDKADNLLYLCLEHHTIVDKNPEKYPAELLRKWKKDRKKFVDHVRKNQALIQNLIERIRKENNKENSYDDLLMIMFSICHDFIRRNLIKEAKNLFDQIIVFSIGLADAKFTIQYQLLNALFLIQDERIADAKIKLLELIEEFPMEAELLFEYIFLCKNFPEKLDKVDKIEHDIHQLSPNDDRVSLLNFEKKYEDKEMLVEKNITFNYSENAYINSRYLRMSALLFIEKGEKNKANMFIDEWEKQQPKSPGPHVLRALYKTSELLNKNDLDKGNLKICLNILKDENEKIRNKDPLSYRQAINLLMKEYIISINSIQFSITTRDLNDICNQIHALIQKCYFDPFIDGILILDFGQI